MTNLVITARHLRLCCRVRSNNHAIRVITSCKPRRGPQTPQSLPPRLPNFRCVVIVVTHDCRLLRRRLTSWTMNALPLMRWLGWRTSCCSQTAKTHSRANRQLNRHASWPMLRSYSAPLLCWCQPLDSGQCGIAFDARLSAPASSVIAPDLSFKRSLNFGFSPCAVRALALCSLSRPEAWEANLRSPTRAQSSNQTPASIPQFRNTGSRTPRTYSP